MPSTTTRARRTFCLVLIKPSRYDEDGYVVQWLRSYVPSNSLAVLSGLARDCAERRELGPDTDLAVHVLDEANTRIQAHRLAPLIEGADAGMVMLVGVQSNQFPRALDIARPFRERGIPVCIGGFHVSAVFSMLKGIDSDIERARQMGISLFAGEAEGRLAQVLRDADGGALEPLYDFTGDLPVIAGTPTPWLDAPVARRVAVDTTSFDAGRGCPFHCSFCTIINVQGRASRCRTPDDVEACVRGNVAQGLHIFLITDDNFARNKDWEPILDRLIHLREVEKVRLGFIVQVDSQAHRIPRFIEKCVRAGVRSVFVGLENIRADSLKGAGKGHNKVADYRRMLLAWKHAGAKIYAGYILGFPNDTVESILEDIEIIKRELPVDLVQFNILTPLPGSEDHAHAVRDGVALETDGNRYNLCHPTMEHPRMSRDEWQDVFWKAWQSYYSLEHAETLIRRAVALGFSASWTVLYVTFFRTCIEDERLHPLEGGALRLKFRRDRRPGLPLVPAWRFYPRYLSETLVKLGRFASLYARLYWTMLRVKRNARRFEYSDAAIMPVTDDEAETHELQQPQRTRHEAPGATGGE